MPRPEDQTKEMELMPLERNRGESPEIKKMTVTKLQGEGGEKKKKEAEIKAVGLSIILICVLFSFQRALKGDELRLQETLAT